MLFTLMNKDTAIAELVEADGACHIAKVFSMMPSYISNIQTWIDGRTSPSCRQNVVEMLKSSGIFTKEQYLIATHGVSLTDTFWLKLSGDNSVNWLAINPYTHDFDTIISKAILDGVYLGDRIGCASPDYTLDGSADKCWRRKGEQIYLYKTNGERWSGKAGNRPYCEYYASQIAEALISDTAHYTPYSIEVHTTAEGYLKPYAICPIFTSEGYGYVPYGDSIYKHTSLDDTDKLLDTRSRVIVREMLLLDSIIINFDRHSGNYGFLANNDTYTLTGLAPIFDNDCSMGALTSLQGISSLDSAYTEIMRRGPRTGMGDYIDQAKWAMTDELHCNLKNMYPFEFSRLPPSIDLDTPRVTVMEYVVNRQIAEILKG